MSRKDQEGDVRKKKSKSPFPNIRIFSFRTGCKAGILDV